MNNNMLEVKEQKFLKVISKIVAILASIGKICIYIGIVSLIICMLLIPKFMKNLKAYDNKIEISYSQEKITLTKESSDIVRVYVNDKKEDKIKDINGFDDLYKIVSKHSNKTLIGYSEAFILIIILYMYLISLVLKYLSKLFKNISNNETPFIIENVTYLRKMGLYMLLIAILPSLISLVFYLFTKYHLGIDLNISNIIEALIVLAMSLIFKYGCALQSNSKKVMYDIKE